MANVRALSTEEGGSSARGFERADRGFAELIGGAVGGCTSETGRMLARLSCSRATGAKDTDLSMISRFSPCARSWDGLANSSIVAFVRFANATQQLGATALTNREFAAKLTPAYVECSRGSSSTTLSDACREHGTHSIPKATESAAQAASFKWLY